MEQIDLINNKYKIKKELRRDKISSSFLTFDRISGEEYFIKKLHLSSISEHEKNSIKEKTSFDDNATVDGFSGFTNITQPDQKEEIMLIRPFTIGSSLDEIIKSKKKESLYEQILLKIILNVISVLENLNENHVSFKHLASKDIVISEDFAIKILKNVDLDLIDTKFVPISELLSFAPELINKVDSNNSQIYSIGVILYEIITSKPVFSSTEKEQLIFEILNESPTLPSLYDFNIDSSIENLVLKCLEKSPEKRFSSLAELKTELETYFNSKFTSNKFIDSFFSITNKNLSETATEFTLDVNIKTETEGLEHRNYDVTSLIRSLTYEYESYKFTNFTELSEHLEDMEKSGFVFTENKQVFFIYNSMFLSGLDLSTGSPIFSDAKLGQLEFLEAISMKDTLNSLYVYNTLFYKKDGFSELKDITSLDQLNQYVLANKLQNAVIKFKVTTPNQISFTPKILYIGNNIINYLFIKFFITDFTFEKKDCIEKINFEQYDFILYDYFLENENQDIFQSLIQAGKNFLVISNSELYSKAIKNFSGQSIFSFDSLNKELLVSIKEKLDSLKSDFPDNNNMDMYVFYREGVISSLISNLDNKLKLLNYKNQNFNITNIQKLDLLISELKNVSDRTEEHKINSLQKSSSDISELNQYESKTINTKEIFINDIINESNDIKHKNKENIVIKTFYANDNNYILTNILKTDEYAYSENLKNRIIENLVFDFNKDFSDVKILKLYKYAKFIVESFFFDMLEQNKDKSFYLLLEAISKISNITINAKFNAIYRSEILIPALVETTDGNLILIDTGSGTADDLFRVTEITRYLINDLKKNIVGVFYISTDEYSKDSLDFYNKEIKAPKIAFFDKLSKIKNIVRLENDKYFHFILLKDTNSVVKYLEIK